ncbi:zinc ribbon domain-containing protein [Neobacillus sp. LXY-4]|uniref:zinc ribbon domain-containing protein n=1 Tax=Neobacillus sp. LXY-4 TaxID=3379826 RepID=UPI003EDECA21
MTLLFLIIIAALIYYIFIQKQANNTVFSGANDKKCPNCSNPVKADFNVCPVCKETLRKKCHSCGNLVDVTWKYCPYCEETLKNNNNGPN